MPICIFHFYSHACGRWMWLYCWTERMVLEETRFTQEWNRSHRTLYQSFYLEWL